MCHVFKEFRKGFCVLLADTKKEVRQDTNQQERERGERGKYFGSHIRCSSHQKWQPCFLFCRREEVSKLDCSLRAKICTHLSPLSDSLISVEEAEEELRCFFCVFGTKERVGEEKFLNEKTVRQNFSLL